MAKNVENFVWQESLEAFGAALRRRREERGFSLESLARATGISKPYLANIETARTPGPPTEAKLRRLEKALAIEEGDLVMAADWLRTPARVRALVDAGRGAWRAAAGLPRRADGAIDLDALIKPREGAGEAREKKSSDEPGANLKSQIPPFQAGALPLRIAPVINRVAAGAAVEHGDLDYPAGVADAYVPIPQEGTEPAAGAAAGLDEMAAYKHAFACRVSGASMEPLYQEGDLVVVAPMEARDGEDCLVRLGAADNFATTLKRVYFLPDHSGQAVAIRLAPRNPAFAERVVMLAEVTGLYPVIYKMSAVRGRASAVEPQSLKLEDGAFGDRSL